MPNISLIDCNQCGSHLKIRQQHPFLTRKQSVNSICITFLHFAINTFTDAATLSQVTILYKD